MSERHKITRRVFLQASPSALAVVAAPALALPISVDEVVPAELLRILEQYHAANVRSIEAGRAHRAAHDAFNRAVDRNARYIRTSMAGDCHKLDSHSPPTHIQHLIDSNLEKRKAYEAIMAERGMAKLASPRSRAQVWPRIQAEANEAFAEYKRLWEECKIQDLIDSTGDAYAAKLKAQDALFAYQVTTLAEVKAITAALYETARATESWYELPGRQLAMMLNPHLGKVA